MTPSTTDGISSLLLPISHLLLAEWSEEKELARWKQKGVTNQMLMKECSARGLKSSNDPDILLLISVL
jgi:proline dehydrogenase